jgi:hypothetical protein
LSCGFTPAENNALTFGYGRQDGFFGRLHGLDVCWLGFWLEREVYIVPRQTALGFVQRANVIGPAGGEHEEHFISFGLWQFFQLSFPAGSVLGILL